MTPINAALEDLKSQKCPNYTQAAKKFGCDRSTLSRRYRGVTGLQQDRVNALLLLTIQQQKSLVLYINKLTKRGIPPTTGMVRNFAEDICKKQPGKNWVYKFVKS